MHLFRPLYIQVILFPLGVFLMLIPLDAIRVITNGQKSWTHLNSAFLLASFLLILSSWYPAKLLHTGVKKKDAMKVKTFIKHQYLFFTLTSLLYLFKEYHYQQKELPPLNYKPYGMLPRFFWYLFTVNFVISLPLAFKVLVDLRYEEIKRLNEHQATRNFNPLKWHGFDLKALLNLQMVLTLLHVPLIITRFYSYLFHGPDTQKFRESTGYLTTNIGMIVTSSTLFFGLPVYYRAVKNENLKTLQCFFIHKISVYLISGTLIFPQSEYEENISMQYENIFNKTFVLFYINWGSMELAQLIQMVSYISHKNMLRKNSENPADQNIEDNSEITKSSILKIVSEVPKSYCFSTSRLKIEMTSKENVLGEGQYGRVWKGTLLVNKFPKRLIPVAIKLVNRIAEKQFQTSLMEEVKGLIKAGSHANLVKFFGVCADRSTGQLAIILELCGIGDLKSWFQRSIQEGLTPNISVDLLYKWSLETAFAMQYLSTKKIIHGDLALRNVLLDAEMTAKISDFGMSLRLYNYQHYTISSMQVFPWKWMAPESLSDLKFSTQSDVWSYGIMLWEMYSLGKDPWLGFTWDSKFVNTLISGSRLTKPKFASDEIYQEIMIGCWQTYPTERNTFETIVKFFGKFCNKTSRNEIESED